MKVAVVILNWNGSALLKEFLPSVVAYSTDAELYLIDNASTDESILLVQSDFPSIKIIQNRKNYGYAGGYNEGLKDIKADIFCLLNSDVAVTKDWLVPIVEEFKKPNKVAVIQPKILDYKKPSHFEYAGAGGGFIDNLGYPYCRGRIFWTLEEDKGQYNDTIPVHWASGASFFIRSEVFWEHKGFDPLFFAHMEEIDLCWRIQNSGLIVKYCGLSTVYHLGGGTLQNTHPKKTFLNFRNSLYMLLKNEPLLKALLKILIRMVLDGVTAFVFWRFEGFQHFKAIFKAHISFYKNFFKIFRKRGSSYYPMRDKNWVPLQYFILKRKTIDKLK